MYIRCLLFALYAITPVAFARKADSISWILERTRSNTFYYYI